MEIHFYEGNIPDNIPGKETWALCHSWQATKEAISDKWPIIRTTQMGCMTLDLLDLGYRIFVHAPDDSQVHEVKLGSNDWTDKELRRAHNIFKMWEAGIMN